MLTADMIAFIITEWLEDKNQSQIRKGKAKQKLLTAPLEQLLHKFRDSETMCGCADMQMCK